MKDSATDAAKSLAGAHDEAGHATPPARRSRRPSACRRARQGDVGRDAGAGATGARPPARPRRQEAGGARRGAAAGQAPSELTAASTLSLDERAAARQRAAAAAGARPSRRAAPPAPRSVGRAVGARAAAAHALLWRAEDTTPYECDGLTAYRERPLAVALPETEEQVSAILAACHRLGVPVVARGAGTGLSGGAMPHAHGLTLSLAKFNRIVKIDTRARTATVQSGVRNLAISEAAAPHGFYYAPDPSSQIACTIGGNVAENSGGVHCLKYGLTLHNVLQVRGFLADGSPATSARSRSTRRGWTCCRWWSAARACWRWSPRSSSSSRPSRRSRAASWPASTTCAAPATPSRPSSRTA